MRSRTCPNCQYRYSIIELLEKPFLVPEWTCRKCEETLTFSNNKKIFLAILGIAPTVLFPYVAQLLSIFFIPVISWMLAIILLLIWAVFIFGFNEFSLSRSLEKKTS